MRNIFNKKSSRIFLGIFFLIILNYQTILAVDFLKKIQRRGFITVATSKNNPPFSFEQNNQRVGFDIEISKLLAATLGVRVKFVYFNRTDELLRGLKKKKVDIIIAAITSTAKRALLFDISTPYFEVSQAAIIKKSLVTQEIQSYFDLIKIQGLRIGVPKNTTIENFAFDFFPAENIQSFIKKDALYEALYNDQIDAILGDSPIIRVWEKENPSLLNRFQPLLENVTKEYYSIFINKGNLDFLRWLDIFINELKINGQYEALYNKYFVRKGIFQNNLKKPIQTRAWFLYQKKQQQNQAKQKNIQKEIIKKQEKDRLKKIEQEKIIAEKVNQAIEDSNIRNLFSNIKEKSYRMTLYSRTGYKNIIQTSQSENQTSQKFYSDSLNLRIDGKFLPHLNYKINYDFLQNHNKDSNGLINNLKQLYLQQDIDQNNFIRFGKQFTYVSGTLADYNSIDLIDELLASDELMFYSMGASWHFKFNQQTLVFLVANSDQTIQNNLFYGTTYYGDIANGLITTVLSYHKLPIYQDILNNNSKKETLYNEYTAAGFRFNFHNYFYFEYNFLKNNFAAKEIDQEDQRTISQEYRLFFKNKKIKTYIDFESSHHDDPDQTALGNYEKKAFTWLFEYYPYKINYSIYLGIIKNFWEYENQALENFTNTELMLGIRLALNL